jgi:hypothetical protein
VAPRRVLSQRQLHARADNPGNCLRNPATRETITDWSLTSLKEKPIKIGTRIVNYRPHAGFQMADAATARNPFSSAIQSDRMPL